MHEISFGSIVESALVILLAKPFQNPGSVLPCLIARTTSLASEGGADRRTVSDSLGDFAAYFSKLEKSEALNFRKILLPFFLT
jgi:hypothetical protein